MATAGATTAISVAALIARHLPVEQHFVLVIAVLSPYLAIGAPVGLVLSVLGRQRVLAAVATATTLAAVIAELPLFMAEQSTGPVASLRVMTANLFLGQADPQHLVSAAVANTDVLAVEELTPQAVARLSAAGLDRHLPFRVLDAREDAPGVGLWSRYPLSESGRVDGFKMAMIRARLRVDGIPVDPTVIVAHMSGPWPQPIADWRRDMSLIPDVLHEAEVTARGGCVVAAGDLNATYDLRTFRDLLRGAYHDAAEQSGAGIVATYPANTRIPPLLAIDHLLTSRCTATSLEAVQLRGSDHRGLVSTIDVPRQPTANT